MAQPAKFLVDAQLPRRLARWLNDAGHDALHTLDLADANRTMDTQIAALADAQGRIVVTKDADFVHSHLVRRRPQRLLLVATGNLGNAALEALFREHCGQLVAAFDTAVFVELGQSRVIVRG